MRDDAHELARSASLARTLPAFPLPYVAAATHVHPTAPSPQVRELQDWRRVAREQAVASEVALSSKASEQQQFLKTRYRLEVAAPPSPSRIQLTLSRISPRGPQARLLAAIEGPVELADTPPPSWATGAAIAAPVAPPPLPLATPAAPGSIRAAASTAISPTLQLPTLTPPSTRSRSGREAVKSFEAAAAAAAAAASGGVPVGIGGGGVSGNGVPVGTGGGGLGIGGGGGPDVPRLRAELEALREQCARCAVEQRALVEQTRSEAALLCESFNCARGRFVVRARQRAPALAKEADVCRAVEFRRWATLCSAELRWIQRLEESGVGGRRPQVAQRESV